MSTGGVPDVARRARLGARPPVLAAVVMALVALAGLVVGAAGIEPARVLAELVDLLPLVDTGTGLSEVERRVVFEIRLPRIALGAIVGAILAMAGAAYQGVFRNPLADPFLLGVAAGAGLGATSAILFTQNDAFVAPFAFAGGLIAVGATYVLGRSVGGRSTTSLILAGVAVAAFATALQTYMLQRNVETIREVYSWILGRLVTVGWGEVIGLIPYAVVTGAVLYVVRRLLDVLELGDDEAAALCVPVNRLRWVVVIAATLATAAAVSVSGLIAFVGIIVPHTIRILLGWSYRIILPMSMLLGASFLMGADIAARTVIAPAELPIGVVTAFLGAPFFLLVLRTSRGAM